MARVSGEGVGLSFHFSRGQNRESRSSVFLCSETARKRLLRRLITMQFKVLSPLNNPLKVCVSSPDWLGYQSLVFKVSYDLSTFFGENGTSDTLRGVTSIFSLK